MTLKEYLQGLEPDVRVWIWGKNNLPFSSWTAKLHLAYFNLPSRKKILKSKVLYAGLDENKEHVVVINTKVRVHK